MTSSAYSIQTVKNVILVRKRSPWNTATDIAYLSDLAQEISLQKKQPFYVLVDMRSWEYPEEMRFSKVTADIHFDRRSQKGECWLLNQPNQAQHLLKYFINQHFSLVRTTEVQDVLDWLQQPGVAQVHDTIAQWLSVEDGSTHTVCE